MSETNKKWIEQFQANYANETKEAKMVMANLSTLEGKKFSTVYAKWGLMELAMNLQDPDSTIVVKTFKDPTTGQESLVRTIKQEARTLVEGQETFTTNFTHMIELEATFLGKKLVEHYPILDTTHAAVKFLSSNDINTSIQRGKARLIARITGIAFELYTQYTWEEDGTIELDKKAEEKAAPKKVAPKKEEVVKEPAVAPAVEVVEDVKELKENIHYKFATFIKAHFANETVVKSLSIINQNIATKGVAEIVETDSVVEIESKLSVFDEKQVKVLLDNLERRVK